MRRLTSAAVAQAMQAVCLAGLSTLVCLAHTTTPLPGRSWTYRPADRGQMQQHQLDRLIWEMDRLPPPGVSGGAAGQP